MKKININAVLGEHLTPHQNLVDWFVREGIKTPNWDSKLGKALAAMSHHPNNYWTRDDCELFNKKFDIQSRDSIQMFNKHEQIGIKCIPITGKNMLIYPYELSTKYAMRKGFKFDGTEEQKNIEIEKIKSTIRTDYTDVPNDKWQLGHKDPDSTDSSSKNLVLQPPIQAKYRDNYIFLDTLTKIPTPRKLLSDIKSGNSPYTDEQLKLLKDGLNSLTTS